MRDRVRVVWRSSLFLLVGVLTGFVSLAGLPFLAIFCLVNRRSGLALLHRWTTRERGRVARFTGTPFPEPAPPERLRDARRDAAWYVLHAVTGTVLGLLGASLPLAAVNG